MGTEVNETRGMTVKLKGLVTYAKGYLVAKDGTTNEGITINYLLTDSLAPCMSPKDGSQGYKFSKSSIPVDRSHKLTHVPGYYELTCDMAVGSDGKPVLKPYDLDLINICTLGFLDLSGEGIPGGDSLPPSDDASVKDAKSGNASRAKK